MRRRAYEQLSFEFDNRGAQDGAPRGAGISSTDSSARAAEETAAGRSLAGAAGEPTSLPIEPRDASRRVAEGTAQVGQDVKARKGDISGQESGAANRETGRAAIFPKPRNKREEIGHESRT